MKNKFKLAILFSSIITVGASVFGCDEEQPTNITPSQENYVEYQEQYDSYNFDETVRGVVEAYNIKYDTKDDKVTFTLVNNTNVYVDFAELKIELYDSHGNYVGEYFYVCEQLDLDSGESCYQKVYIPFPEDNFMDAYVYLESYGPDLNHKAFNY